MRLRGVLALALSAAAAMPAAAERNSALADTAARTELGWFVAPLDTVDSERSLPVFETNLETERAWKVGLEWPTRAWDVGMRAVGPVIGRRTRAELERGDRTATLVVVQRGLADDSVGGTRERIELDLQFDGTWRLRAHLRSVFCPRGPGRGAWIEGPCR